MTDARKNLDACEACVSATGGLDHSPDRISVVGGLIPAHRGFSRTSWALREYVSTYSQRSRFKAISQNVVVRPNIP